MFEAVVNKINWKKRSKNRWANRQRWDKSKQQVGIDARRRMLRRW